MADQVILYLNSLDGQQAQWLNCSQKGEPNGSVQYGSLSDAAQFLGSRRCVVVIEGALVHLLSAAVPGGNAKRAATAIPYILEEQLAADVETLHFALGEKDAEGQYRVGVIAEAHMQSIKNVLLEHGIVPHMLIPSTLLLPTANDNHWQVLCHQNLCTVRQGGHSGFQASQALASHTLQQALAERDSDETLQITLHYTSGSALPQLPENLPVDAQAIEAPVQLFAQNFSQLKPLNLLQGDHSHKQQLDKLWKPWRLTAALAAVWACVALLANYLEYRDLGAREQALNAQIERVFRDAFPEVRRVVNPSVQMKNKLKQLKQQGAPGHFLSMVSSLATSLPSNSPWTIKAINFRNGYCDVDLETQGLQSLDSIKRSLEEKGSLRVRIQSANQDGSKVKGRLRLEART